MKNRWRVVLATTLLVGAGVVGLVGYLRISAEAQVPSQLVYLASTGFAVIVLAIAGGSLLVADQVRSDDRRLDDLESAVAALTATLAPALTSRPGLLDEIGQAARGVGTPAPRSYGYAAEGYGGEGYAGEAYDDEGYDET